MIVLALSIAWAAVVTFLLARAIRQYGNFRVIGPALTPAPPDAPSVSVIVPARNEEHNIRRCLQGLQSQDYPRDRLRVAVVDDGSEDATASIVREFAAQDARFELLQGDSLPQGWLGKPHACWQGAQQATGEWLCFIDADTVAGPALIRTALLEAHERAFDMLSLQPFQELITFWERLILPCGFFLLAFTQDLRSTNDPASPEASVNGQFLLLKRTAYFESGGHAAVRDAIAEDSALARNVKRHGFRLGLLGTQSLLSTRMYTHFRPLWEGAARQAAQLLGNFHVLLLVAVGALLLAWGSLALPIWAVVAAANGGGAMRIVAVVLSAAATLALFGTHIGAARYFKVPIGYGLLYPLGYTLGACILVVAALQRSRQQVRWKGRVYADHGATSLPSGTQS